ncbi:6-pyruvoyl trahydropterin synthase family protein [Haloarcula litorea]|uniref:6-pyruvoyl trahydropterin synthase family protein n=1 Tax=Haloarcula litorea TaxID=3032579 RepID=UPI0023E7C774|nr:6-carboxytetrahydropterin synthase [Halomicroarcula sp. GDY20]
MYELAVSRDFVAQHFLTVPDPGPEGEVHSHHYEADVRFAGPEVNEYGYLVDIDAVEAALDEIADRYRDELLNDVPAVEGNPSVERFARVFADDVAARLDPDAAETLTVRMWEDDVAWASYERPL